MNNTTGSESDVLESLLAEIADEYRERLSRGEQPDIEEYVQRYPQLAGVLRQLLPALAIVRLPNSESAGANVLFACPEPATGCLGDFRLLREIGRGGMGIVYEAEQVSLGRRVALKVLPFAAAMDAKQLQRFKNEAQAAAHLHHTNIVPVYAVGCERGVHFYAMQYIEGQTVAALIRQLRQLAGLEAAEPSSSGAPASALASELASGRWAPAKRGPVEEAAMDPYVPSSLPAPAVAAKTATPPVGALSTQRSTSSPGFFRTVAYLGIQAAEALEHAHQLGVIHRDIKPANLLVDAGGRLWVTDFGLAQCRSQPGLTITGDLVGTLRYMSPEQASAKRGAVDHRSDVYSLSVTLYELLTLEPAYAGRDRTELLQQIVSEEPRTPRRLNPAVPAELETIVLKALAKHPDERYATAQNLADDLERFLDDKPIQAKRPSLWGRTKKWARRHKTVVRVAGIVVALTMVALLVSMALIWRAYQEVRQTLYFHRIALAEREWAVNNLTRVDQLLAACPAELRDFEWRYLRRLRRGGVSRLPLEGTVFCVAFSPDGQLLAAGNMDGTVKIWDTLTWREFRTLPPQEGLMITLAFSPQGRRLATASWDSKGPRIWDLDSGRVLWLRQDTLNYLGQIAFSPDSRWLAAAGGSQDLRIKIWDANTGELHDTLPGHERLVHGLTFSPDGQRLASAGFDYTVKVWDLKSRTEVWSITSPIDEFYRVAFSLDGRLLAAAGGHHFNGRPTDIYLFDAGTGKELRRLHGHTKSVLGLAFSPEGRRLASGSEDLTVKLWHVAGGKEAVTLHGHLDSISDVAFSPDGHRLASAGADGTVRIWDGTPLEDDAGEELHPFHGHTREVYCLAFSPDGERLASGSEDLTARIWDVATGKEMQKLGGFSERVEAIAFSPNGQWLAAGSHSHDPGFVFVWNTQTGQEQCVLHGSGEKNVAFSPDSQRLAASSGSDCRIWLWDVKTGQPWMILLGHKFMVPSLAFSPDGRRLASGSYDTTVKVWDVTPEQQFRPLFACGPPTPLWSALVTMQVAQTPSVRTLTGFDSRVMGVAFRPDGERLAAGGMDRIVRIWSTKTWQQVLTLRDSTGGITCLAFSPDGRRLATGSTDSTVKLWDADTGELLRMLHGHTHWVSAVAFSPNGRRLASSSMDGTVKLWDPRPWSALDSK